MPDTEKRVQEYLEQTLNSKFTINSGPLAIREFGGAIGEFILACHLFCSRLTQAFVEFFNQITPKRYHWGTAQPLAFKQELADHLQDAYEDKLASGMEEEQAWTEATKRLGDPNKVIEDLRSIHLINAMEWVGRVVFFGLSLAYFESIGGDVSDFVNYDAFLWMVTGGAVAYLLFAPRCWAKIQRYLLLGALAGIAWGFYCITSHLGDIERVGHYTALIYIAIVYGAIFGKPKIISLLVMIFVCNFSLLMVFYANSDPSNSVPWYWWLKLVDYVNVGRICEWAIPCLLLGWPLFGRHHYISRLPHLAVVLMIIMHIQGIKNLSSVSQMGVFAEGTLVCLTIIVLTLLCSREAREALMPFSKSRNIGA